MSDDELPGFGPPKKVSAWLRRHDALVAEYQDEFRRLLGPLIDPDGVDERGTTVASMHAIKIAMRFGNEREALWAAFRREHPDHRLSRERPDASPS